MLISTDALPKHIEPAVNWISGLIGAALDKRVSGYEQQERLNPLLGSHFREYFALEFALAAARRRRKSTGRLPKGDEYHPLYSFLIPAQRIHSSLQPNVKTLFEGRLHQAVNSANGLRPLAYEIAVATHFMQKGWDVEFVDYSGSGRFDLLARRQGAVVEIECKTTSGDTGRKVHRQEANRLADLLLPVVTETADIAGCHRILITVPDRLGKTTSELQGIAALAAFATQQGDSASSELAQVDYAFDGVDPWPQPNDPNMLPFFEQRFGIQNATLMFLGCQNYSVVAIMIRSAKPDSVIETISDDVKEAAGQCSGTRPALVAVHLIDEISRSDLGAMLTTPNGLHAITHAVFKDGKRRHVDSIAFTVPQAIRADNLGARQMSGDLIMLNNPDPLFTCAEIRSIFRAAA